VSGISHLHDLILELGEESINNLVLLDGERVEVDLLHAVNLAGLDETAELRHRLPLLLLALTTTASTATTTTATTVSASGSETTATGSTTTVSHFVDLGFDSKIRGIRKEGAKETFVVFGWVSGGKKSVLGG